MPNIPAMYDGSTNVDTASSADRANPPAISAPDATTPGLDAGATTSPAPAAAPQLDYGNSAAGTLSLPERNLKADSWGEKVYHGVLNALGGGGDVSYSRGPDGKMVATPVPTGPGTQWKKIIAGALTGFSAAAQAGGTGPGSGMHAAGAGVGAGLKMGMQRDADARAHADQDFEEGQKAATAQAQRALLNHQIAASTFDLGRAQVQAAVEDSDRETKFEQVIGDAGEGAHDMGVFPDFQTVIRAFNEAPELHDHQAGGRIVSIPHINGDGKVDGLHAAWVTPSWLEAKINRDLPIVTRTYKNGKVEENTFTVPAGSLTGAQYTSMVQAQSQQSIEDWTKKAQADAQTTQAGASASEANSRARMVPSEIAKNDAAAALDKAKAASEAAGGDTDWGPGGEKGFNTWHKDMVTPALQAERTYRLASNVYNEYQALRKQGKDFPTGAQSVQMLSYHMANTFGNVKGARITKDLIQKHMGARSISDSAEVAINKLVNGEQLSAKQWDAYFSMVGQNRDETWRGVLDDAEALHRPLDYIAFPKDLRNRWAIGPGRVDDAQPATNQPTNKPAATQPPGGAVKMQAGEPTAKGANGELLVVRGGKWVTAQQ